MKRVHLRIAGRVQGVYFRASAREAALRLGVCGWVRNRRDGTVELVAEGTAEQLDDLVGWCHQGPPMAQVESVEATRSPASEALGGFDVRPTT